MHKLTALVLVVSSLAFAQTEVPKPKAQEIVFEPSEIGGEAALPMGSYHLAKDRVRFTSLIKVRADFNDKLAASVHEM